MVPGCKHASSPAGLARERFSGAGATNFRNPPPGRSAWLQLSAGLRSAFGTSEAAGNATAGLKQLAGGLSSWWGSLDPTPQPVRDETAERVAAANANKVCGGGVSAGHGRSTRRAGGPVPHARPLPCMHNAMLGVEGHPAPGLSPAAPRGSVSKPP